MSAKFKAGDWLVRNGECPVSPLDGVRMAMMGEFCIKDHKVTIKPIRKVYWVGAQPSWERPDENDLVMRRIDGVFEDSFCRINPDIEAMFDLASAEEVAGEIERCDRLIAKNAAMGLGPAGYLDEYKAARDGFLEKAASPAE